jgi:hypothetical protein
MDTPPLKYNGFTSSLALVLVLLPVLLASPEQEPLSPEQAAEEVQALLPLLPEPASARPMARSQPVQSSQKT